ncbi:MAG: hypothetical protein ACRD88_00225, partial [Terriglobia bacterium]
RRNPRNQIREIAQITQNRFVVASLDSAPAFTGLRNPVQAFPVASLERFPAGVEKILPRIPQEPHEPNPPHPPHTPRPPTQPQEPKKPIG